MKIGDIVKVVKLTDDRFDGKHPNGIGVGFEIKGQLVTNIEVGSPLFINHCTHSQYEWFHTSVITEIIDENTFKTLNSTYSVTLASNNEKS